MDFKEGAHVCWMYDNDTAQEEILAQFIVDGLEHNHRIIFVVPCQLEIDMFGITLTPERLSELLKQRGVDELEIIASGQLVITSTSELCLSNALFDPDKTIASFKTAVEGAIADGYAALRATVGICWALSATCTLENTSIDKSMSDRLIYYESEFNKLCKQYPIIGLCGYDRRIIPESTLLKVLCTHPIAALNKDMYDNFYYIPPEQFRDNDDKVIYEHWTHNLKERKKLDTLLRNNLDELKAMNSRIKEQTEQRIKAEQANALLEQANKQRSEFIANMSHHIRTPLNGILSSASILRNLQLTTEQLEVASTIEQSTDQLLKILTELLQVKMESPSFVFPTTPSSPQPIDPSKLQVLVVEDNMTNQVVLRRLLQKVGCTSPDFVDDGKKAVEQCGRKHYELIFMDIFLPVMDGLEATRHINKLYDAQNRKRPTIAAVTASVTEEIRNACLTELGMIAFISKPVKLDHFVGIFTKTILPSFSITSQSTSSLFTPYTTSHHALASSLSHLFTPLKLTSPPLPLPSLSSSSDQPAPLSSSTSPTTTSSSSSSSLPSPHASRR